MTTVANASRNRKTEGRQPTSTSPGSINVTKLSPTLGAEVGGVDLSRPLTPAQAKEIADALHDNLVIVFRQQHLSVDQHKGFGRLFGELHIHPAATNTLPGHPEVLVIRADENSKRADGEEWHSDVSCDKLPPMGSLLYAHEVPPDGGGDTVFASAYALYDALSEPMKRFVGDLTAVHDGQVFAKFAVDGREAKIPRAEHPVVRTHPVTGRKGIYVNPIFTRQIMQLKKQESAVVLAMLYGMMDNPEFQVRIKWDVGTLVFWDNRCTLHQAIFDYHPHRRLMHRVTVLGDRPF